MSAWRDLVTASLIGTERAVVPLAAIPGLSRGDTATADLTGPTDLTGPVGPAGPADPAELLLDRAALMTAARRAGRRPGHAEPPAACEPDPRPAAGPAATRRLARMLGGEHPDLLAEWLAEAAARGLRPAPWLLPPLLEAARAKPGSAGLRRLVAEAGGPLARWLAALNPEWQFVVSDGGQAPDTGPQGDAVGPADEAQRMTERALRCVRIEHGIRGARLVVTPPIDPEIMARIPLRAWTDAFGRTAAQILAVPAGDWTSVLFVGWSRAAVAQHDRDWAAALIGRALTGWPVGSPPVADALNRLARRADPSLGAPGAVAEPGPGAPAAARRAVGVLRFRYDMLRELEDDQRGG